MVTEILWIVREQCERMIPQNHDLVLGDHHEHKHGLYAR
jgi:hypothetical protein